MDIDLNCDLGKGCATDADLMPLITSANIACGFHADDPAIAHAGIGKAEDVSEYTEFVPFLNARQVAEFPSC